MMQSRFSMRPKICGCRSFLGKSGSRPAAEKNLRAQRLLARFPLRQRLISSGNEVGVGVWDVGIARVLRGNLRMSDQTCGDDGGKRTQHGYSVVPVLMTGQASQTDAVGARVSPACFVCC